MNEFIQMKVFFFIASALTFFLCVLVLILIVYIQPILKNLKSISEKAKDTTDNIGNAVNDVTSDMRSEGKDIVRGFSSVVKMVLPKSKK